ALGDGAFLQRGPMAAEIAAGRQGQAAGQTEEAGKPADHGAQHQRTLDKKGPILDHDPGGTSRYTASTAVTSGTKCFSRFSMPCFSVMLELGQPEQAPCICR